MFVDGDALIASDGGRLLRVARDGSGTTELGGLATDQAGFAVDPFGKLSRFDLSIDNGVVESSTSAGERGSFFRSCSPTAHGVTQDHSTYDNVDPDSQLVRISETGDVNVIADGLGYTNIAIDGDTFVIASAHREDAPGFIATVPIE